MRYVFILLFLSGAYWTCAQSCTGSVGDPIVDITFGQGGTTIGPALGSGITNLSFVGTGCPNDGQYSIVSSTNGCGVQWLSVPHDHTGDRGYFMLINASFSPSDFYVQTIDGLCPGTSYQFAAWVLNMASVSDAIKPNITFRIEKTDGTLLGSYETGDIAAVSSVQWTQYGIYFSTPAGVSTVVIRMTNNAPGGNGNDVALDDITFRAAGPSISTNMVGYTVDSIALCQNDPGIVGLSAAVSSSCYVDPAYQWQVSSDEGSSWQDIAGATSVAWSRPATTVPGVYYYRLVTAEANNIGVTNCSVASSPMVIDVLKLPSPGVSIGVDQPAVCAGSPAVFTANIVDGGPQPAYLWLLNNASTGVTTSSYTSSSLTGTDVISCQLTSDAACVVTPTVVSNDLSLDVIPVPVTGVDISASATKICADSLVTYTATANNGGASPSYVWQIDGDSVATGSVFSSRALKDGDVVSCRMMGSLTCSLPVTAPETYTMTVYPLPVIQLTPDTIIASGQRMQLAPVISGNIGALVWSPVTSLDDPMVQDPVTSTLTTITYTLKVVSDAGCSASASERVEVFYDVGMPSAFSPNGDGQNDIFRVPPSVGLPLKELAVYNRWGLKLFETSNPSDGWDGRYGGTAQPPGVYVWELVFYNPLTKKEEVRKGTVVLVR